MPHKHKRKRGDDGDYELPPSQRARPLIVRPNRMDGPKTETKRRGKGRKDDDTPRAFRRLMAVASGHKIRSGLDDGLVPSKKSKKNKNKSGDDTTAKVEAEAAAEIPRIRPGEDMRAFAARVDAAIPVSGLTRKTIVKDGKDEQGMKVWRTRKERKMHKLYDQWHAEERKIQELREDELEREAERELENDGEGIIHSKHFVKEGGKKGRKKDDDPWAVLKKKRAEAKVSLHDQAQAPPELHKKKTRQLRMHGDAGVDVEGVPKSAGSLRRREEVQAAREEVLEAYRKIREHEQAKLNAK